MFRVLPAALLLSITCLSFAAAPAPPEKEPPRMPALLFKTIKSEGFADPKATLKQYLENLSKVHDIAFTINEKAFEADSMQNVGDYTPTEKPIPASDRTRLDTVLHELLARIPAASGATYLVRRDSIEITTNAAARAQIWGDDYSGPFLPLVHMTIDKKPLEEALKELADQAEFNIVLDPRAAEKAKTPVNARFLNTPLDSAAHFLADSADLQPVVLDNVIYVTTKENASRLEVRFKKEQIDPNTGQPVPARVGGGVRSRATQPPPAGM